MALGSTRLLRIVSTVAASLILAFAATTESQVLRRDVYSKHLEHSKIGTNPMRKIAIYLPPGYQTGKGRYPVIYFLPDTSDGYSFPFDRTNGQNLFDSAIARGAIAKFVFVSVDMNTPVGNSWSVNSPATGNWEDFFLSDLVPYVDANFRTLTGQDSRGIAGDRMGGYGAIRFGMRHPEVFGSVYALHPVGVGPGLQTMYSRPNWDLLTSAKSIDDLKMDGFSMVFAAIFQAFLPNPENPPLFADLPARKIGNQLSIDPKLTGRLQHNFFLEGQLLCTLKT